MNTCECGQPGTEVCYQRGSTDEIWFCSARKHTSKIRQLAAQGWLTQSAAAASSPTGTAIRRNLQAA